MVGRFLPLACIVMGLGLIGPPPASAEAPAAPSRAADASVTFPLAVLAGDYVKGTAETDGGRFDIDLATLDGQTLRRLATGVTGRTDFYFVAPRDGLMLRATGETPGGHVVFRIASHIASADQVAPPRAYLSPAIAALAETVEEGGGTEAFWQDVAVKGTPLIEPLADGNMLLTFLARGATKNVRMFGAPSGDHENLERIGGSDTWFKSFVVPPSTRLSYQLAPDVPDLPGTARERRVAILATAAADPFNRHPWPADAPDGYNQDSLVELADAPPQPGIESKGAPKGTLREFSIASAHLGNERTITLYIPAGFDPADPRNALLFVFDARQYLTRVPTPTILDNLSAEGRIPPTIAVFVSAIDSETRTRELPANADFADFMAEELLPRIRQETGAAIPAGRTVLAGSSFGGLAAVTTALRHPEAFGNAASLSGSFWWHPEESPDDEPEYVAALVAREPRRDIRIHLSAGLFEIQHGSTLGILDTSRHLRDVLRAKGYPVSYRDYAGGHDYFVWQGALGDALIALLGHDRDAR